MHTTRHAPSSGDVRRGRRLHHLVTRWPAGRTGAVWLITVAVAVAAWLLLDLWVATLPWPRPRLSLPWFALAGLFALAESCVAHLEFRREAHSFSLSDVAFTIGLFAAPPPELIGSYLAGSAFALVVVRRQRPMKLVFNLAIFAAAGVVASGVFALLARPVGPWPTTWAATFAAIGAAQLLTTVAIYVVISIVEGDWTPRRLTQILTVGLITSLVNTGLGLLVVSTTTRDVREAALLLLPAAMLVAAYRAYAGQRRKRESLGLLCDVSRSLSEAPTPDAGITALLGRVREALRCEAAELVLFPSDPTEQYLVATVTADGERALGPAAAAHRCALVASLAARGVPMVIDRRADPQARAYVDAGGHRDAIIAPIRGETRMVGALVVRGRMAESVGFSEADCSLFAMLANHAGATLENGRLERSLAQVTQLQHQLRQQAYHDFLTTLPNRAGFTEHVHATIESGNSTRAAVLFIDLDDFKSVNDTLGHAAGDELLAHAANRLRRCLRSSDVVARLGGDEFAVLLADADERAAASFAERIISALRRPFALCDGQASVGASIGVAYATQAPLRTQELLRNADLALYEAKARGKNRYAVFEPALHSAAVRRRQLRDEIGQALEDDAFVVQYQPFVELDSGRIVGAEALVRWRRPEGSLAGPDAFIDVAEESGLIVDLGRRVLHEACRQAATWWSGREQSGMTISVNVSAAQLQHPSMYTDVCTALETSGLEPSCLVLELTEGTCLRDIDATLRRLEELTALGVRIAIDDFGTGYSSLSYLRRLPVDILKLDKSFIDDIGEDADAGAVTSAIVNLAHSLRVTLVAEGIETSLQRSILDSMGCALGQGYHLGRPMSADVLGRLMAPTAVPARDVLKLVEPATGVPATGLRVQPGRPVAAASGPRRSLPA